MSHRLARVLAHPLRNRVLFEYLDAPACPSDVARRLGQRVNLVSYHTDVLARHGCLELVRTERRRGALTRYYRSTVGPMIDDAQWAQLSAAQRRALTMNTLGRIAAEARQAAVAGGFDAASAQLWRWLLDLDEAGAEAVSRILHRAYADIASVAEAAGRRGGPRRTHEVAVLAFVTPPPRNGASARLPRREMAFREEARGVADRSRGAAQTASAAQRSRSISRPASSSSAAASSPA